LLHWVGYDTVSGTLNVHSECAMPKRILRSIVALLALQVMFISSSLADTDPQRERVVIAQFGKEKFLLYLPLYIAMEEGLFAKKGLDVDLRFAGNDDQIFATVISGAAQFGVGDPVFAAISREKGGPGKIVAVMVTKLGLAGYTNKATVPDVIKAHDATGLRIGSLPAPSTTYTLLSEFVRTNNLEGTKVVQAAIGTQLAALEAGRVDLAVDLEPTVSLAESKGYRVNFLFDRFTEPQAITGISTLESTIQKRPDLVQKVVSALQEGLDQLHAGSEVPLRVTRKLFPNLSEAVVQNAVKRMIDQGVYPRSVKVDDSYWQRTLRTRLDSGDLKKPQTIDTTVDNSFAEKTQMAAALK
jgi:NitT/TauT family transport system substrate-binding protein